MIVGKNKDGDGERNNVSEELTIEGRKKDGDGERNKWSGVKCGDFRSEFI